MLLLYLFIALAFPFPSLQQTTIKVTDKNWYFTEYNWHITETSATSVNPGAYFKLGFTGTSLSLEIDSTKSPPFPFLNMIFSLDDKPFQELTVPHSTKTSLTIGNKLPPGDHDIILYIYNSIQTQDRWNTPSVALTITGATLDTGESTVPPKLLPKRTILYGDSITEGVEANCVPGGDLFSNNGIGTYGMALGLALDAEISIVGFGRLGWTVTGNGNVPPFFTPGNPGYSSWNFLFGNYSRNFGKEPDHVFILHGTNDGLGERPEILVYNSVLGWLKAQRSATPKSKIFLCVPFGLFEYRALTDAFSEYKRESNDDLVYLLDLAEQGSVGLVGFVNGGTREACDGIHPRLIRHGQLGAILALNAFYVL